jgi:hypothetical protein
VDGIRELEAQSKEAYYELRDMAKDAILSAIEKQIEV